MTLHAVLLLLHVLGATVWTGGHLVFALSVLPRAMHARDVAAVHAFEAGYERLGIGALVLQVATGLALAWTYFPDAEAWFVDASPVARLVRVKLALLAATLALAAHVRLRVLPRLDAARLPLLYAHVLAVTAVAVGFVVAGVGLRLGFFG
jgi:putative copper export protein